MSLRGGECPLWGWGEARRRTAEALREVWLQGVFSARSEPCCDDHLPVHHQSVPRAGALQGLPETGFLRRGTDTVSHCKQYVDTAGHFVHAADYDSSIAFLLRHTGATVGTECSSCGCRRVESFHIKYLFPSPLLHKPFLAVIWNWAIWVSLWMSCERLVFMFVLFYTSCEKTLIHVLFNSSLEQMSSLK